MFKINLKNNLKEIILLFIISFSVTSFGADAQTLRLETIGNLYTLATIIATSLGILLIILAIVKMKRRSDNPNDAKAFPSAIITTFICGALLFNFSTTSDMFIKTFLGNDAGYCVVALEKKTTSEISSSKCWDASQSEILKGVQDNINDMNGSNSTAKEIEGYATTLYALAQLVGFIFILKGIYTIKVVSEGSAKNGDTHMSGLKGIFFGALMFDLSHTVTMVKTTIDLLFPSLFG